MELINIPANTQNGLTPISNIGPDDVFYLGQKVNNKRNGTQYKGVYVSALDLINATTGITGLGTTNRIPVYINATTLGDSVMSQEPQGIKFDFGFGIIETSGDIVINPLLRILSNNGTQALNWTSRTLCDVGGNTMLNWATGVCYSNSGSSFSIDWINRQLYTRFTGVSLDWANRVLKDNIGVNVLDWSFKILTDGNGFQSMDWNVRKLRKSSGQDILDWENNQTLDNAGNISMDWVGRRLYDNGLVVAVDWQIRTLKDSGNNIAIEWQTANVINIGLTPATINIKGDVNIETPNNSIIVFENAPGRVLAASAVTTEVVVSDTTLTIMYNGVTYKLLAKA